MEFGPLPETGDGQDMGGSGQGAAAHPVREYFLPTSMHWYVLR